MIGQCGVWVWVLGAGDQEVFASPQGSGGWGGVGWEVFSLPLVASSGPVLSVQLDGAAVLLCFLPLLILT